MENRMAWLGDKLYSAETITTEEIKVLRVKNPTFLKSLFPDGIPETKGKKKVVAKV